MTGTSSAQTFQRGYGGTNNEFAPYHPIEVTSDGGTIMVGTTYSVNGSPDLFLMKLDATGAIVWQQAFGDVSDQEGHDVVELTDFGGRPVYIAVGATRRPTGWAIYVVEVSATGAPIWERYFDTPLYDEFAYAVTRYSATSVAITGIRRQPGLPSSTDIFLLHVDAAGGSVAYHTYGRPNLVDAAYGIDVGTGGSCTIVGYVGDAANAADGLMFQANPLTGLLVGTPRSYGSSLNNDTLFSVENLSGDATIAAGTVEALPDLRHMWGLKTQTSTGAVTWSVAHDIQVGPTYRVNLGADIRNFGDQFYALTGTTARNVDGTTIYTKFIPLTKLNTGTGFPLANSTKIYGLSSPGVLTSGYGIRSVGGGDFLIGGHKDYSTVPGSPPGTLDMHLIRADAAMSAGCWEKLVTISSENYVFSSAIDLDVDELIPDSDLLDLAVDPGFDEVEHCFCETCKRTFKGGTTGGAGELLSIHEGGSGADIHIVVGAADPMSLEVVDVMGRRVRTLAPAKGVSHWDATDDQGRKVPNGLYYVVVRTAGEHASAAVQIMR
jgi:hypothetical protein